VRQQTECEIAGDVVLTNEGPHHVNVIRDGLVISHLAPTAYVTLGQSDGTLTVKSVHESEQSFVSWRERAI
jgi:hypothetical protein